MDNIPTELVRATTLANTCAFAELGYSNSCILTSHGLVEYLQRRGLPAEPVRVEVHMVGSPNAPHGALGWKGDGTRRKATPGGWAGHLAVSCGDYVLDPTLDQLIGRNPFVFRKPPGWDTKRGEYGMGISYRWRDDALQKWDHHYKKYYPQWGWKSKGAARRTNWLWLTEAMESAS